MQRTGARPDYGVRAPELVDVACRPTEEGPFMSLYLHTEASVENAAQLSEAHWRALRQELDAQGAPEELLRKIDPIVPEAHHSGSGLAVVANRGELLRVENLPELGCPELARWSPVASIAPLIRWRQESPPLALVLADRRGADIFSFDLGMPKDQREAGDADWPIHKAASGGWSQRHHQARVENTWEHNARDVAEEVTATCERTGAQMIALAGDARASAMVRDCLPPHLRDHVHEISGGRSPDGSDDLVTEELAALLSLEANRVDAEVAELIQADKESADRAVIGWPDVLTALAAARVGTLVVDEDAFDAATAWFGEDPLHVAATKRELSDMGVENPRQALRSDIAIRAALGSGASVRIAGPDGPLAGGPAALLRWSETV